MSSFSGMQWDSLAFASLIFQLALLSIFSIAW